MDSVLPYIKGLIAACHSGWQRGLFSGFNGNMSVRVGSSCLITRTGSVKFGLQPTDFALIDIADGHPIAGAKPSSEAAMHCAVYRRIPKIDAIAHTHPPHLLALCQKSMSTNCSGQDVPSLPLFPAREHVLFESAQFLHRLGWVKDFAPGSTELAEAVAAEAIKHPAIWMHRHGLTTCGKNPFDALALAEELEHLAHIELLQA
jgi:L-fuculose-phosphate aldolase